jgi:hypothetical protein
VPPENVGDRSVDLGEFGDDIQDSRPIRVSAAFGSRPLKSEQASRLDPLHFLDRLRRGDVAHERGRRHERGDLAGARDPARPRARRRLLLPTRCNVLDVSRCDLNGHDPVPFWRLRP